MNRKLGVLLIVPVLVIGILCGAATLPRADESRPVQATGQGSLTSQEPWYLLRSVSQNDAALTGSTKTWGSMQSLVKTLRPWGTVTLSFLCYGDGSGAGDPNGGSFSYEVYACRINGSAERVCGGNVTVGEVQASVLPFDDHGVAVADATNYKWAEGSSSLVGSQSWDTAVGATTATDEIGKISWDPLGCPYLYVRVYNITGLTTVYVLVTGR